MLGGVEVVRMSESGVVSEGESEWSGSEEESDLDPSYDYTGEESGQEEEEESGQYSQEEEEEEDEGPVVKREQREDEWQYCEQGVPPRRKEPPQVDQRTSETKKHE